jgi:hypothetical protein
MSLQCPFEGGAAAPGKSISRDRRLRRACQRQTFTSIVAETGLALRLMHPCYRSPPSRLRRDKRYCKSHNLRRCQSISARRRAVDGPVHPFRCIPGLSREPPPAAIATLRSRRRESFPHPCSPLRHPCLGRTIRTSATVSASLRTFRRAKFPLRLQAGSTAVRPPNEEFPNGLRTRTPPLRLRGTRTLY